MTKIPQGVRSVLQKWSAEFSETVWPRFQVLMFTVMICVGRHTICRLPRIAGTLTDNGWCDEAYADKTWA
jgi:hypothetical protein